MLLKYIKWHLVHRHLKNRISRVHGCPSQWNLTYSSQLYPLPSITTCHSLPQLPGDSPYCSQNIIYKSMYISEDTPPFQLKALWSLPITLGEVLRPWRSWPRSHSQTSLPTILPPNSESTDPAIPRICSTCHLRIPSAYNTLSPNFSMPGFSLHSNILSLERLLLTTSSKIVPVTLYLLAGCMFYSYMHWLACCLSHFLECRFH